MRGPRTIKGRPIFLHVASLSFHYGPEVGASRHSLIRFRDLGAKSNGGPEVAGQFSSWDKRAICPRVTWHEAVDSMPKSRQDFARELFQGCVGKNGLTRQGLSSLHSTWFAVLHTAFTFIPAEQWRSEIGGAMKSQQIECMPRSHRGRITH